MVAASNYKDSRKWPGYGGETFYNVWNTETTHSDTCDQAPAAWKHDYKLDIVSTDNGDHKEATGIVLACANLRK